MYCNKASGLCVAITSNICRGPLNSSSKEITTELVVYLKGTRCLGSDELVYKKAFVTYSYEMHMVRKMF